MATKDTLNKKRNARVLPHDKVQNLRQAVSSRARTLKHAAITAAAGCAIGSAFGYGLTIAFRSSPAPSATSAIATPNVPTLGELLEMTSEQLARQDIAAVNLRCAEGLPGSERLDIAKCLSTLDQWAQQVHSYTDHCFYTFRRNPNDYNNSEAYFRTLALVTVLQRDLKVHYDFSRITNPDFRNSRDLFIHGMIGDVNGGTCASMPVLYVAVGRRLGYPLKLVSATSHLFARWDDGQERFNIEGTNHGLTTPDDNYYKTWPLKMTPAQEAIFLKSMSPAEELATFMASRGDCLEANGKLPEAQAAYAEAHRLVPKYPEYLLVLANILEKEIALPNLSGTSLQSQSWPSVFNDSAVDVDAINRQNRERMERMQPRGTSSPYAPNGAYPEQPYSEQTVIYPAQSPTDPYGR